MKKRNLSGQVLLVSVLIIALLLLSTVLYVYDLGNAIDQGRQKSSSDFVFAVQLGSKHVLVGSLANVSQGGVNQTLGINLEKWTSFVGRRYEFGKPILDFTLREATPYSSGIWISWGTDGLGVSGAYANFTLKLLDRDVAVHLKYAINATTTLSVKGTHRQIQGSATQVNVACSLLNEGDPALARNITLYYRDLSDWLVPGPQNNYTIMDYGNGTYFMSFVAGISPSMVDVSVHVSDQREISVQANVTCTEI